MARWTQSVASLLSFSTPASRLPETSQGPERAVACRAQRRTRHGAPRSPPSRSGRACAPHRAAPRARRPRRSRLCARAHGQAARLRRARSAAASRARRRPGTTWSRPQSQANSCRHPVEERVCRRREGVRQRQPQHSAPRRASVSPRFRAAAPRCAPDTRRLGRATRARATETPCAAPTPPPRNPPGRPAAWLSPRGGDFEGARGADLVPNDEHAHDLPRHHDSTRKVGGGAAVHTAPLRAAAAHTQRRAAEGGAAGGGVGRAGGGGARRGGREARRERRAAGSRCPLGRPLAARAPAGVAARGRWLPARDNWAFAFGAAFFRQVCSRKDGH